eukprot:CAMPEP_0184378528 /NCGR_PEP_ID=MMETSP0007-20130409/3152_1 /TAXON_ID=97485 /ORGANISM="Prymnesium parvum, Strain Texoma1" /LENGTH=120 /DNA_ID=CAMNT_0026722853 /DNA_START=529 /DNA_END=888 /DNA_ORIENTATION=+
MPGPPEKPTDGAAVLPLLDVSMRDDRQVSVEDQREGVVGDRLQPPDRHQEHHHVRCTPEHKPVSPHHEELGAQLLLYALPPPFIAFAAPPHPRLYREVHRVRHGLIDELRDRRLQDGDRQ